MTPRPLADRLVTIAREARATLREERSVRSALVSLDSAAFLAGVPALAEIIARLVFGASLFGTGGLIAWSIALPTVWIVARAARHALEAVSDEVAIAEVDRALGLEDRLIAAHEFIAIEDPGPFHRAAIEDADAAADVAIERGLPRPVRPHVGPAPALRGLGAALLVVAALAIDLPLPAPGPAGDFGPAGDSPRLAERSPDRADEAERPPVEPPVAPEREAPPADRNTSGTEPGGERSGEISEDVKKTIGKTTSGKSSSAAAASGASRSKGTPSNQSQASEAPEKRSKRPNKKPKEGDPDRDADAKEREPEEMSGATAGRGAASGSSKSPSASKWSSKDQVTSDDEEELEEDEEVDDEFDDSEARGGVQPQLRDRKPPVNRDLTIGFGNQKNPDANGRGGASEQKKSRGVATLVLGVPIPDHVKGRPNPGKTKITQERVEPQEEQAAAVQASARPPRSEAIGRVPAPDLLPWMRDLVVEYFSDIRAREARPKR